MDSSDFSYVEGAAVSTLFISTSRPPELDETVNYRIDPVEYARLMRLYWPYAKVGFVNSPYYVLSWELNQHDRLGPLGGLQTNKSVVSFGSNPQEDAIEFILWHRDVIPSDIRLFLFNANLDLMYELKPGVNREDLITLF